MKNVYEITKEILDSIKPEERKIVLDGPTGAGKCPTMSENFPYTPFTVSLESRIYDAGAEYVNETDEGTFECEFESCSALIEKQDFEYLVTAMDDQVSKTFAVEDENALIRLCKKLGGTYVYNNLVGCITPNMSYLEHIQMLDSLQ
jgi:hypothetical protein